MMENKSMKLRYKMAYFTVSDVTRKKTYCFVISLKPGKYLELEYVWLYDWKQ